MLKDNICITIFNEVIKSSKGAQGYSILVLRSFVLQCRKAKYILLFDYCNYNRCRSLFFSFGIIAKSFVELVFGPNKNVCPVISPVLLLVDNYNGQLLVIVVNIYDNIDNSLAYIEKFFDGMKLRINIDLAADDSDHMTEAELISGAEQNYEIPSSFIVNADPRLTRVDDPKNLDTVLSEIVDNNWTIERAIWHLNERRLVNSLERGVSYALCGRCESAMQTHEPLYATTEAKLDSVKKVVQNEPHFKYTSLITYATFSALSQNNQRRAYDYCKLVLTSNSCGIGEPYQSITEVIESNSDTAEKLPEIYYSSAAACNEAIIRRMDFSRFIIMEEYHRRMAKCYWREKNKLKEVISLERSLKALKIMKNFHLRI